MKPESWMQADVSTNVDLPKSELPLARSFLKYAVLHKT